MPTITSKELTTLKIAIHALSLGLTE